MGVGPIGSSPDSSGRIFRAKTAKSKAHELDPRRIPSLTGSDMKALSKDTLNWLIENWASEVTLEQFKALTPEQIKAIPPKTIPKLLTPHIKALSKEHIQVLTEDQLGELVGDQIVYFSDEQIKSFTMDQMFGLAEMLSSHRSLEKMTQSARRGFLVRLEKLNPDIYPEVNKLWPE